MDTKLLLDSFTAICGALAGVYQWWNTRFRSRLKTDLEILKSLEPLGQEEANYKIVKAYIDATITKAYACGHSKTSNQAGEAYPVNLIDLIFCVLFFLGSILWIWRIAEVGVVWWRILISSGFAFVGFIALFNVIHKRHVTQVVKNGDVNNKEQVNSNQQSGTTPV